MSQLMAGLYTQKYVKSKKNIRHHHWLNTQSTRTTALPHVDMMRLVSRGGQQAEYHRPHEAEVNPSPQRQIFGNFYNFLSGSMTLPTTKGQHRSTEL